LEQVLSDSSLTVEGLRAMSFSDLFLAATGHQPFPWQTALYEKFITGHFPASASIPTGLGKTSIVAVWLIALAFSPHKVPRRLVYVVNRRTVVDQTTAEVEKIRLALSEKPELKEIAEKLLLLCALPLPVPDSPPLAISTLRGQFADNREWSADPTRPAVIIGTVDMIGSGLLFSRYAVSFKLRPHHAAFLAQDVLLIHDEAHLEPAFQHLLDSIVAEQVRSNDSRTLRVMELSATTRSVACIERFQISEEDEKNKYVNERLNAVKNLSCVALAEGEKITEKIPKIALEYKDSGRAILIFVRSVESANKIAVALDKGDLKGKVRTLTGTMRGKERDALVKNSVFQRFLPESSRTDDVRPADGTVILVATSAGEVGVNISADDLVCDLSTYESMAQRFGRVNRFGKSGDSTIIVLYSQEFPHTKKISDAEKAVAEGKKDAEKQLQKAIESFALDIAIEKTLELLHKLGGDASPVALEQLPFTERAAGFSPPPKMRATTDIQFDAWALTSIRERIAARPPVAPYLHGEAEWEPPETYIAWREEVDVIKGELLNIYPPEDLLEDFPLKPQELLRDTSRRIAETLSSLIEKFVRNLSSSEKRPTAWLLRENGIVKILPLIPSDALFYAYKKGKQSDNREKDEIKRHKERLEFEIVDATLILPASIGGISEQGFFDANSEISDDVADIDGQRLRIRSAMQETPDQYAADYRLIRFIDTQFGNEGDELETSDRYWLWLEAKKVVNAEYRMTQQPETLADHTGAAIGNATAIAEKLLPATSDEEPDLRRCLICAAALHDLGKNRRQWQFSIGNSAYDPARPETIFAKSGGAMRPRNLADNYRHEFGSIADISASADFAGLSAVERDIVLHLIAAHHGRARPHFPAEEIFDYNAVTDVSDLVAAEAPLRFARLQRTFGRWGLAWLESLLRAADYAASAGIVAVNPAVSTGCHAVLNKNAFETVSQKDSEASISLRVDVSNPGQYFACCGLFELAARLASSALAYFEQESHSKQWWFIISNSLTYGGKVLDLRELLVKVTETQITATETDDTALSQIEIGEPFNLLLDWWRYEGRSIGKLKTWAGQMSVLSVAQDMKKALRTALFRKGSAIENILFDRSVENVGQPYYFDANYAVNAQAQDVGFSVDKLKKGGVKFKTATVPALELLCLIGLQRARPMFAVNQKGRERLYDYCVWNHKIPIMLVSAAVGGFLGNGRQRLRFSNPSRAKDYRAFMPAVFQ
jgi:CRISPR-associated endonuclease/helicase Cas3